jgi:hypothetical protein
MRIRKGIGRAITTIVVTGLMIGLRSSGAEPQGLPPRISPKPAAVAGMASPTLDLGGEWRFHPAPPVDFGKISSKPDGNGWGAIQVPGQWTQQGFTVDTKTAAGYWRTVALPADWAGRRVKLRCDGVYSRATVWINGREIGKHEGGFTPFEFDITDALKPGGQAVIALAVRSSSDADEYAQGLRYACHDIGGITRKIQLLALPAVNVAALHVNTRFEGGFDKAVLEAELTVANEGNTPAPASGGVMELRDPQGQAVAKTDLEVPAMTAGGTARVKLQLPVFNPQLWDVEHPRLYTLTTTLGSGPAAETLATRVGFRQVEIRDKGFWVNGRAVKLRGICRHESHPLQGRCMRGDEWRKDVEVLARANINFVRTSHYPPAEELLEACDELGMLVQCEAPFCWAHPRVMNGIVLSQVQEMVEFNRNHPSIVMWSLGNESQFGPAMKAATAWVRDADPARPLMFSYSEGSLDYVDMASHHYPDTKAIVRVTKGEKPVFFDEYAHLSDSNRRELISDPGVRDVWGYKLAKLWELMRTEPGSLGGAIWVAMDDTFFLPGGRTVGYGAWGPLDGWRRPKPEYWHVAKVYTPVRILEEQVPVPAAGQPIRLTVENRSDCADLKEMRFNWKLADESGQASVEAAPGQRGTLAIAVKGNDLMGKELEVHVVGPRGFEVDAYRFILGEGPAGVPAPLRKAGELKLTQAGGEIVIQGEGFGYVVDATTGQLKLAKVADRQLPLAGPCLTVIPMNAENGGDRQLKGKEPDVKPLWGLCTAWKATSVSAAKSADRIVVKVAGNYAEAVGGYELAFDGAGRLTVAWNFTSPVEVDLRQLGIVFSLPKTCDTLTWRRRGQWNFYPDDHIGRLSGQAKAFPGTPFCGLFGPRTKPGWPWSEDTLAHGCNDFRATKLNILTATLCDERSVGLRAVAAADRHAHAWMDGDQAFFAVLDYANDGVNEGLARDRRGVPVRVIEKGGVIAGSAQVELVGGPADAAEPLPASKGMTEGPALVYLDSRDYGISRNMTAMEMERGAAVSRIKIIGGASGDTRFDVRTFCQVAKARGRKYYVLLKAEECGDFSWTYHVGFTDNPAPDIKKEFGAEFSETDESGNKRPVVRVADLDARLKARPQD